MSETSVTIAHTITDRALANPFHLKASANAWWNDVGKVRALITGFKMGYNVNQAIVLASITKDQYYYFLKHHPEFSDIKERFGLIILMKAKQIVADSILKDRNVKTAFWYLNRYERLRDEEKDDELDYSSHFCARCQDLIKKENEAVDEAKIAEIVQRVRQKQAEST